MYKKLLELLEALRRLGVDRALLVGGCVRDAILAGTPEAPNFEHDSINDFDVECFGVDMYDLELALLECGATVDLVGASFGVIKAHYDSHTFDFSVPRTEIRVGVLHTDFDVQLVPDASIEKAAERRDLTINAIYFNPAMGKVIDPFYGVDDLDRRLLRQTSFRFCEDPLRVLRVFQFTARLGFLPTVELGFICKKLLPEKDKLTRERVWGEWEKWCLKSTTPGRGLAILNRCDWLEIELSDLIGLEQDPEWHPEGDVFNHTCYVVDAANDIRIRESLDREDAIILMLAALCHDFGKSTTTIIDGGRWRSPGHDSAGVPIALSFLEKIGCPIKYIQPVLTLVKEHMTHLGEPSPRVCRRLVNRLVEGGTTLQMLALVVEADASGRFPLPKKLPENMKALLEIAEMSEIDGTKEIPKLVMGRDLIELGVSPGPGMGVILDAVYQKQLDEGFTSKEEALVYTKTILKFNPQ